MERKICKVSGRYFTAKSEFLPGKCEVCHFEETATCTDDNHIVEVLKQYLGCCITNSLLYVLLEEEPKMQAGCKIEGTHAGMSFIGYTVKDDEDMPESVQANVVFSDGMFTQLALEELETFVITDETE